MIVRDFGSATRRRHDLIVVGGGIYGVSLLWEASRRGLSACLCEAADFGGGTSWNSLRIVHGGLRYLQTLDLRRFFQSVAARRRLAMLFPDLVRPLQCLMPLYADGLKRRSVLRLALAVNDQLSRDRNSGVANQLRLPPSRVIGVAATRTVFPAVRMSGLEGAACWSDYLMISSERIITELLHDACTSGACALNYAPVTEILSDNGTACGVRVQDATTGESHELLAGAVVNCTGPQVGDLARTWSDDAERLFQPSLAFNVLLDLESGSGAALAVAAPVRGAPVLFVLPTSGITLAGTMHVPRPAGTFHAQVTEKELLAFLEMLNAAIPGFGATRKHVKQVFAGLLPATAAGAVDLARKEVLIDHGRSGTLRRFISVSGVKFTTASDVAAQVLASLGLPDGPDSAVCAVPMRPESPLLIDANQLWGRDSAGTRARLASVIASESVHCLDDLILRRANWGVAHHALSAIRKQVATLTGLPANPPLRRAGVSVATD